MAIINCCEHEFSIATQNGPGANPLNPIQQCYSIKEAKNNADVVVVIVHGGPEHIQLPSLRMKELYRFFIDSGADVVVNHHQHCFSGKEVYNGKPIYYGLGNFCFDSLSKETPKHTIWNEGFMLSLNCSDKGIETKEIPYHQCGKMASVEILRDTTRFFEIFNNLSNTINDDAELSRCVSEIYESRSNEYDLLLEPYNNPYLKKLRSMKLIPTLIRNKKRLRYLNYIECESHRERLIYNLRNRIK